MDKDERNNVNEVIDSADHDAGTNAIGLDSLRREDEVRVLFEVGVDVAEYTDEYVAPVTQSIGLTQRCGCQG